ncbi:MAG TPA: hypothetical protein ENN73_01785, partial [Firmicutes bacterium]|nr:hypothetical protein [Bacillota bacterium]
MKKAIYFILFAVLLNVSAFANLEYYRILSNSRAEPLAMGGAYFGQRDDFNFIMWNPAAFVLETSPENDVHFRFNISLFLRNLYVFTFEGTGNGVNSLEEAFLLSALSSFKGISYVDKKSGFYAACLLFEEVLSPHDLYFDAIKYGERPTRYRKWLNGNGILDSFSNHLAVGYPINKQWNFGYALHYYRRNFYPEYIDQYPQSGYGHSFGIHYHDNMSWNVGLTYYEMPLHMTDSRLRLERVDHQSLNLGISYQFDKNNTFNLDVRDLEKGSERPTAREVHAGFSSRFGRDFILRGGYFKEADTENEVWSVGCGIWNLASMKSVRKKVYKHQMPPTHNNFIFNFGYIYESRHGTD